MFMIEEGFGQMSRLTIACVAAIAMLPGVALTQQGQVQPRQDAPGTKDACQDEVRRVCGNTLLPIPMFIHQCLAENESKLSDQCRAFIRAARANQHAK
jgi:hypothetical protein